MTKARFIDNGNVKLTVSVDQFIIIYQLFERVRLGTVGRGKNEAFEFLEGLQEFVKDNFNDDPNFEYSVTSDNETIGTIGTADFVIEIKDAK